MKHSVFFALTSLLTPMLLFSAPKGNITPSISTPKEMPSITPDYGPLPGHQADLVIAAEFLYWFPNMSNTDYALKRKGTFRNSDNLQSISVPVEKEEFDWNWDPGLRIDLGTVTNHDGWDAYANWTYFHSRSSKSKEVAPFEAIEEGTIVFTSPWFFSPHNDPFNRIKAKTSLTFNQVDLEKGRHFWISRHLSMRPSVGIRGYWTRTTFSVHGKSPLEALTFDSVAVENQTKIKQKSWGVGLLAGLENVWHFSTYLSIFGTADISLTYGKVRTEKNMAVIEDPDLDDRLRRFEYTIDDAFYRLQPIFDLALGLRFESTFANDRFRMLIDLGYEYHYLYDHVQFLRGTYNLSAMTDQVEANGDLSLSGLVLRGRFEF